jgi:hypothetical protein
VVEDVQILLSIGLFQIKLRSTQPRENVYIKTTKNNRHENITAAASIKKTPLHASTLNSGEETQPSRKFCRCR